MKLRQFAHVKRDISVNKHLNVSTICIPQSCHSMELDSHDTSDTSDSDEEDTIKTKRRRRYSKSTQSEKESKATPKKLKKKKVIEKEVKI